jgi:hypothetical protein
MAKKKQEFVMVAVPVALAAKATFILEQHGSDLETFVRLQLGAFCRVRVSMKLADTMSFGKYIGEKVEDVVRTDLRYMVYILGLEGASVKFGSDVLNLVNELLLNEGAKSE